NPVILVDGVSDLGVSADGRIRPRVMVEPLGWWQRSDAAAQPVVLLLVPPRPYVQSGDGTDIRQQRLRGCVGIVALDDQVWTALAGTQILHDNQWRVPVTAVEPRSQGHVTGAQVGQQL